MKRTTVAYVDSSKDRCKRYLVIQRGSRLECNCLDFFFKKDRNDPCRHIKQVLRTTFADDGRADHLKAVSLTPKGVRLLQQRFERERRRALQAAAKDAA